MINLKKILSNDKEGLGAISTESLYDELARRETTENPYPLDVFHPAIKPYITWLSSSQGYDIPREFIGNTLLCAYSTAIGTGFAISPNGNKADKIYLAVWACNLGISSSGKSLALDKVFAPLQDIQAHFDYDWNESTKGLSIEQVSRTRLNCVVYRQSHIPTLTKAILPDNPKGVCKINDELLEWINGMNQLSKKEGTDEQFWLSTWNAQSYDQTLSGKQRFVLQRPFVNVIGGTQYKILHRFFEKDRDTSGFIFRMLFARPAFDKIANGNISFSMPVEINYIHKASIQGLYKTLRVEDFDHEPNICVYTQSALNMYSQWVQRKIQSINALENADDKDTQSSILGKIKEYAHRFAAILFIMDKTYEAREYDNMYHPVFNAEESISSDIVERALRLADYYFNSMVDVYKMVSTNLIAPKEVLVTAYMLKANRSIVDIAQVVFGNDKRSLEAKRKQMDRLIKKWIIQYPKVFGANNK